MLFMQDKVFRTQCILSLLSGSFKCMFIIAYCIVSFHDLSYSVIIASHHTMPCQIMSCHILSYLIVLYNIIFCCYMLLYYIIPCRYISQYIWISEMVIDLRCRRGHRYGVIGSNGSGKTTLMARCARWKTSRHLPRRME